MGMSASQARYLQLTARKTDLEFEAQQICHKRLTLAERTERIATAFSEKINDRKLYYNAPYTLTTAIDDDGNIKELVSFGEDCSTLKRLDYYDITNEINDENQPGLGMRIVDSEGRIIVPELPEGGDPAKYLVVPGIVANRNANSTTYAEACDYLENRLRSGDWLVQQPNTNKDSYNGLDWVDIDFYNHNNIDDLLYKDNDSAAEAEYTQKTETIQRQDKMLEMRLNQITTQQNAVQTEMDAVEKVLQKNVENSFKTFA